MALQFLYTFLIMQAWVLSNMFLTVVLEKYYSDELKSFFRWFYKIAQVCVPISAICAVWGL